MKASLVYGEYDCGNPCTPNGCPGHESTIPEGFTVNHWVFVLDGCRGDSLPFIDDPRELDHWTRTLEAMVDALNAAAPVEADRSLPDGEEAAAGQLDP